ncbi:MAG: transcriptional activator RfaH [Sphingobium sp.]|nr:MAG: transcriptional activator RfaH [Sphingobium sp.]
MYEKVAEASQAALDFKHPWFVAQIKPNSETIAKRNLLQQGINIFMPFEELTVRKASKLINTGKTLFPGYLFVSFDPEIIRWRTVNSTIGVSRLVGLAEDKPAQVPLDLIAGLMRRCDPFGKLLPPLYLHGGDLVRVTNGPFAEFIGTVEHSGSNERIWILLDILGKNTRVAIRSEDLSLAG